MRIVYFGFESGVFGIIVDFAFTSGTKNPKITYFHGLKIDFIPIVNLLDMIHN